MSITLVLGIGNRWRGDDAAGLLTADALRAQKLPGVTIIETTVVDPALIDAWQDVGRLIVVDVVMSGAAVGTVHRLDLSRETFFYHAFVLFDPRIRSVCAAQPGAGAGSTATTSVGVRNRSRASHARPSGQRGSDV
ncbi:MAG: hydrogenase maturation protease [Caldilinea sp.]